MLGLSACLTMKPPTNSNNKPETTPAKRRKIWENLSAGLVFVGLSVWLFGRTVILDLSGSYLGTSADPSQYMWALVWWPYAIAQRLNPFVVSVLWAPFGYNLAWFTSIPGPSLIMYPVTRLFGPVVAYNLWCILAPAASAWTCFILCRYITQSFWPSLIGGYVFGFSSYIVGQMYGHPDLLTVFPVPIAVLLVLLRLNQAITRRLFIAALAFTLTFQFLSSPELFATMTIFGAMAICLGLLLLSWEWKASLYSVLASIAAAYLAAAVLLSPFLYYMLVPGEPAQFFSPLEYSTDLLNFVVPITAWLGARCFHPITARFHGNCAENGAYLGLPLLLVVYFCARRRWEQPAGKLLVCCFLLISLASFGPRLHVAGVTTVPLPWKFFQALPLIDQALPARFVMYSFLIAAIIAAIYLSSTDVNHLTRWLLGALAILFIWPVAAPTSKVDTPNFFASGIYRRYLAAGDTLIILPFANNGNSLLWQAQTGMKFRMAGAYMEPRPSQSACWQVWRTLDTGHLVTDFPERLKPFLVAHGVKAIIVTPQVKDFWLPLLATIDSSPIEVGGVTLYRMPPGAIGSPPDSSPAYRDLLRLEARAKLRRYAELISAADKYLSQGPRSDTLTPWEAERLNLLSYDWTDGAAPDAPKASPEQGDLWLGPWPRAPRAPRQNLARFLADTFSIHRPRPDVRVDWENDGIGVGITGCRSVLEPAIQKFGIYAIATYFPYPYKNDRKDKDFGRLLMVFSRSALHDAARAARLVIANKSESPPKSEQARHPHWHPRTRLCDRPLHPAGGDGR